MLSRAVRPAYLSALVEGGREQVGVRLAVHGDDEGAGAIGDTPVREDARKLLDNGWTVLLFRNQSGSYTSVARRAGQTWQQAKETPRQITDARTPEDALSNLVAKLLFNRHAPEHFWRSGVRSL